MANESEKKNVEARDIFTALGTGVLAIGLILYFAGRWDFESSDPLVGKPAPEIEYEVKNGKKATLTQKQGTTVLLNFWASWCAPCMEEMPSLSILENHFGERGLLLLAFNIEDSFGENLRAQFAGNQMPRNLIFNFSKEQLRPYRVQTVPLSVLIDKKGVVRRVYNGPRNWMDISILREIEAVLKN